MLSVRSPVESLVLRPEMLDIEYDEKNDVLHI
jgi:hypothetical protein